MTLYAPITNTKTIKKYIAYHQSELEPPPPESPPPNEPESLLELPESELPQLEPESLLDELELELPQLEEDDGQLEELEELLPEL